MHSKQIQPPPALFFARSCLICLRLGSLLPHTHQPGIAPCDTKRSVSVTRTFWHVTLLDIRYCLLQGDVENGEQPLRLARDVRLALANLLNFLFAAVRTLLRTSLAWEQDQSGAVFFEAGDVGS